MFIEQQVRVKATHKQPQNTNISLSPMILRHYEDKGRSMSNELVQFLGLMPVSTTLVGDTTENIILIRMESDSIDLVDVFVRNFLSRDENGTAVFEGEEIPLV